MDGMEGHQASSAAERTADEGSGAMDLELLPTPLRPLLASLIAVPPTIRILDLQSSKSVAGQYFRSEPSEDDTALSVWWDVRMRVLGLIACCPSLQVVDVAGCGISREPEVEHLCEGLRLNAVLRELCVGGNAGFGTDHGCRQLSRVLRSSSTLEKFSIHGAGLRATGLALLVGALVANPEPRLQLLDLEHNQELGDESSGELLAQLLSNARTGRQLKNLQLRHIGLTVAGAARLSAGLERSVTLRTLSVGPGVAATFREETGPLSVILGSVRCSQLVLSCSDDQNGLAEGLVGMLRTNASLQKLVLQTAHFSVQQWHSVFVAFAAISTRAQVTTRTSLEMKDCSNLDHNSIHDLVQLVAANPGLFIPDIEGSALRGGSQRGFYCCCPSCVHESAGEIGAPDSEKLPYALRAMVDDLPAVPPTISTVDCCAEPKAGDYFRLPYRWATWWQVRMWVLGLIATCRSLTVVTLRGCPMLRKSEVQRLCDGFKSNKVIRHLDVGGNIAFGSDFGCKKLSDLLRSISTLKTLSMRGVGLRSTGLSQLVRALVSNRESRLQGLDLSYNEEMGDATSGELLAQLLSNPRTATWLKELQIQHIGLTAAGAAALSVGLAQTTSFQTLKVGPGDAVQGEEGPLKIVLSSVRCEHLHLLCSDETNLANNLANYLLSTSAINTLFLLNAQFSTQGWRCVLKSLATSSVKDYSMINCATLDHNSIEDLEQLLVANPDLLIREMQGCRLKGGSQRARFYCYCPSCMVPSVGSATTLDAPTSSTSSKLERLMNELSAILPSIKCINGADMEEAIQSGPYLRLRLLQRIGTCSSLTSITLPPSFISWEDRDGVDALCAGLALNPVLEQLVLCGNPGFGTEYGCAHLGKVISGCARTLRHLNVSHVSMSITGLRQLTHALQGNISVFRSLDISDNGQLGDGGAMLIAELLRSSAVINFLKMSHTGMGRVGAQALLLALQCNASITHLGVGEITGKETTDILLMGLVRHPTLKRLALNGEWSTRCLATLLESNATLVRLKVRRSSFPQEEWKSIFEAAFETGT